MHDQRLIFTLAFAAFGGLTTASIGNFLPFTGFRPIPFITPEPVDVKTSAVTFFYNPRPLTFSGNRYVEKAQLKNTGYSVEAILSEPYTTQMVTGGVLGRERYVYRKTRFYWANNTRPAASAYTTVNGKNGRPLEASIQFYNTKYSSFREALKYRNGVVKFLVRINIGSKPNPAFKNFAAAMKKIRKAGQIVDIQLSDAFSWYMDIPPYNQYFAYPGAYTNESTGVTEYCTTTIVNTLTAAQFISKKQFQSAFLQLLDYNGKPLINQESQVPQGLRPTVRSFGILQKPFLFVKYSPSVPH